jgi:hypothetical protein
MAKGRGPIWRHQPGAWDERAHFFGWPIGSERAKACAGGRWELGAAPFTTVSNAVLTALATRNGRHQGKWHRGLPRENL